MKWHVIWKDGRIERGSKIRTDTDPGFVKLWVDDQDPFGHVVLIPYREIKEIRFFKEGK